MITVYQRSHLVELCCSFAVIMILVWCSTWLGQAWTYSLGGISMLAVGFSLYLRRDSAIDLGLSPALPVGKFVWIGLAGLVVSVLGLLLIGSFITPSFWQNPQVVRRLSGLSSLYWLGVPLQQLLLHGYFTNRLSKVWHRRPVIVALLAGTLFAVTHIPNPVLTAATFVFGTVTAYYFIRSRNLYLIIFAHLALSHLTHYLIALPLLGRGSMRVGSGFWQ